MKLCIENGLGRVAPVETTDRGQVNLPVFEHLDPFGRHATLISMARQSRPTVSMARQSRPTAKSTQKCCFCHPNDPEVIDSSNSIALNPVIRLGDTWVAKNKAYFNPIDHEIIFRAGERNHITEIGKIRYEDIRFLFKALHERIVDYYVNLPNVNQVNAGCNFHSCAGSSQDHLHLQIGAISCNGFSEADKIAQVCRDDQGIFISDYLDQVAEKGLMIKREDGIAMFVPWAPRAKDEIHLICTQSHNFLDIKYPYRIMLYQNIYQAVQVLPQIDSTILGFNINILGARFSGAPKSQRLLLEILPRRGSKENRTNIAHSELMNRWVVDKNPVDSAEQIREILTL